jgi:hypothetical protein
VKKALNNEGNLSHNPRMKLSGTKILKKEAGKVRMMEEKVTEIKVINQMMTLKVKKLRIAMI